MKQSHGEAVHGGELIRGGIYDESVVGTRRYIKFSAFKKIHPSVNAMRWSFFCLCSAYRGSSTNESVLFSCQ